MKDLERLAVEPVQARQRIGRVECRAGRGRTGAAVPRADSRSPGEKPLGSDTPWAWNSPKTGSPSISNGPYAGPR